jgi:hypothetical protein
LNSTARRCIKPGPDRLLDPMAEIVSGGRPVPGAAYPKLFFRPRSY